jgi:putative DNA primase/helicase
VGALESEGGGMMAAEIHARIGSGWPRILAQLGVPEAALRNRHGPCPGCGGKDRFRFDNKHGRGDFICARCGAGDGFALLERVHGWAFTEARKRVIEAAGLSEGPSRTWVPPVPRAQPEKAVATPTERIFRLRRGRCRIEDCADAVDYLASRGLWPLPEGCTLRAHASLEYFEDGKRIGRYPAIVADVVDAAGALVTVHVTYLERGRKLADHDPRKILSGMTGREGCAVRLMPAAEVLGIAEGIETALSAALLDSVPVWAALNTAVLARFGPPAGVATLRLYADRDVAGLEAAARLMERLQGRVRFEVCVPPAPAKDFNDVLTRNAATAAKD